MTIAKSNCDFCPASAVSGCFIDAGNNAEIRVHVKLCGPHLEELDLDPENFFNQHAVLIEELAAQIEAPDPE